MVEPAWAVAETAKSGSKREIERKCLVNIVWLLITEEAHRVGFYSEFAANRQPVT
jgi:hypothetical protein